MAKQRAVAKKTPSTKKATKPAISKASIKPMTCAKIAQPIGPYTMGRVITTESGTWGYSSGQIGMNPKGELTSKKPGQQARVACSNLEKLAKANGFTLADTIKTTVFLIDMGHFAEVNAEYAKFFDKNKPPRSCVAVHQLPKGALFEIEAVFFKA